MSQTNIFQDYSIVPWYNNAEWEKVYKLIYDDNSTHADKKLALETLIIWQQRMPLLPSGVEGTLCILEALSADERIISERQYQILGASSIMRFLNICVASRAQMNNFTQTAKEHGIPDWIIAIRHDFAHSQKLPSATLLKLALQECYTWLQHTYWETELEFMSRKTETKAKIKVGSNGKRRKINFEKCSMPMHQLVGLYCYMFVNDARGMCYDEFIQNQLEELEAYGIVKDYHEGILRLLEHGVNEMAQCEWKKCLMEMMNSLFYTVCPESLKDKPGNSDIKNVNAMMNLLEKCNVIPPLVLELQKVITDNSELDARRVDAAMWINEIIIGMIASRMKQNKKNEKIKTFIQFNHLHKSTFELITQSMKYLLIMEVPELYHMHYITNYLQICGENIEISKMLKSLHKKIDIYDESGNLDDFCKLQTKEEDYLKIINNHLSLSKVEETHVEHVQDEEITAESDSTQEEDDVVMGCWTLVKDTIWFESCAIGVLPEQWIQTHRQGGSKI